MQKHTIKNDTVPIAKGRLGIQHSKSSSANIKNKDKNLNENDNTVLLMLNHINTTINIVLLLEQDLKFTYRSELTGLQLMSYCEIVQKGLSKTRKEVVTQGIAGCNP